MKSNKEENKVKYDHTIVERCYQLLPYKVALPNVATATIVYKIFGKEQKELLIKSLLKDYYNGKKLDNNNFEIISVVITIENESSIVFNYQTKATDEYINRVKKLYTEHELKREKLLLDEKFIKKLEEDVEEVIGKNKHIYNSVQECIDKGILFKNK